MLDHQAIISTVQDNPSTKFEMDYGHCCTITDDFGHKRQESSSQCDGASSEEVSIRGTAMLVHDC